MRLKWVGILLSVFFALGTIAGYYVAIWDRPVSPYLVDKEHKAEDKWLKIPVVDPWRGKVVKGQPQGEIVGHLYIKTTGEYTEVQFVHAGDTCRYSGDMAWEALGRAMAGKGPMLNTTVNKE